MIWQQEPRRKRAHTTGTFRGPLLHFDSLEPNLRFSPKPAAAPSEFRMDYYRCSSEELRQEVIRRGYTPFGSSDQHSEGLNSDDDTRGTEATTIQTSLRPFVDRDLNLMRTAEFGSTVQPSLLVGQRIVYWTLNAFFPTLQLFFESGMSCTIEGSRLANAAVGLDRNLRFRLTDCTHEEDGRQVKSTLPDKFAGPRTSIVIREASCAYRTSVAVKPIARSRRRPSTPSYPQAKLVAEEHMVLGLRLEGMKSMGYVWARVENRFAGCSPQTWGHVRLAGLRDDVPSPFLGFPEPDIKPGGEATIIVKESVRSNKKPRLEK